MSRMRAARTRTQVRPPRTVSAADAPGPRVRLSLRALQRTVGNGATLELLRAPAPKPEEEIVPAPAGLVRRVADHRAFLRGGPPKFESLGKIVRRGTDVTVLATDRAGRYAQIAEVAESGEPEALGWTAASNLVEPHDTSKYVTDGTLSEVSYGETNGLFPSDRVEYYPALWDAGRVEELLAARAAVHAVGGRGQAVHRAKPPAKNKIEKALAVYHLVENFPAVDAAVADAAVKWFYLSKAPEQKNHLGLARARARSVLRAILQQRRGRRVTRARRLGALLQTRGGHEAEGGRAVSERDGVPAEDAVRRATGARGASARARARGGSSAGAILALQRAVGNDGVHGIFAARLQAKLAVSRVDDPGEVETDRAADEIVRAAEGAPSPGTSVRRSAAPGASENPGSAGSPSPASEVPDEAEARIHGLRGNGVPLPDATLTTMERGFGTGFRGVRVHVGPDPAELASAVGARAFTVGKDIVFGAGEYAPTTSAGQRLLAHELAHVVQQGGAEGAGPWSARGDEPVLRQAAPAPAADGGAAAPTAPARPVPTVTLATVLAQAEKLYGLPYAFSADDTCKTITAKQSELAKKIDDLNGQLKQRAKGASAEQAEQVAALQKQVQEVRVQLGEAQAKLLVAQGTYWDTKLKVLFTEKAGAPVAEVAEALRQFGVVCNTYVEILMRTSGFADFPLTGQPYQPASKKLQDLERERDEQERKKGNRRQPGWGLEWAERLVDWTETHGVVLYDHTDPGKQVLPSDTKGGDLVVFLRPSGTYHVNLVVADGDKFNFAGASRPGRVSGTSLRTPFEHYGDLLPSSEGPRDLPTIMGQKKYAWILRPDYAPPV